MLFRVQSFDEFHNGEVDYHASAVTGVDQGCFYLTSGIFMELTGIADFVIFLFRH
jgi:hypothetical protein